MLGKNGERLWSIAMPCNLLVRSCRDVRSRALKAPAQLYGEAYAFNWGSRQNLLNRCMSENGLHKYQQEAGKTAITIANCTCG